jgi:hypothetical protein
VTPGSPDTQDTPPSWFTGKVSQRDGDAVEITLPSLAARDDFSCVVLNVLFEDSGDGGPVVEWTSRGGERQLLSAGLGEVGLNLGMNSRTVLLPESMCLDGGVIRISYPARFAKLRSIVFQPAAEVTVASLWRSPSPALITDSGRVLGSGSVVGGDEPLPRGDTAEGRVVRAELSATPLRLDLPGSVEFQAPLSFSPRGIILSTEVTGLDPESRIDVSVNGVPVAPLGITPPGLGEPGSYLTDTGRLRTAGWHPGALYLPPSLWKTGENSVILTLSRAAGDPGGPVHLRKVQLDLLFHEGRDAGAAVPSTVVPSTLPGPKKDEPNHSHPGDNLLTTGSTFGNPSPSMFRTSPPDPRAVTGSSPVAP